MEPNTIDARTLRHLSARLRTVPKSPQGLLDFAFSPLFGENNFFYLSYTCILDDGVSGPVHTGWTPAVFSIEQLYRTKTVALLETRPKYSNSRALSRWNLPLFACFCTQACHHELHVVASCGAEAGVKYGGFLDPTAGYVDLCSTGAHGSADTAGLTFLTPPA